MKVTNNLVKKLIKEEVQRAILAEQTGKSVELTTNPSPADVSAAWPHGVMYNGDSVFEKFYGSAGAVGNAHSFIENQGYEGQESYLGYDPSSDTFVMGFDAFEETYDEYGNLDNTDGMMSSVIVDFDMVGGGNPKVKSIVDISPGGMYPEGLRSAKRAFPGLIDVRLD